jgi:hypothetical protein
MPYYVETAPAVLDFFAAVEGISNEGRTAIIDGYIEELGRDADRFLALYPLAHESYLFRYDYAHPHSGILFNFDFIVDGSHMEVGVVRVMYVELTTRPFN